LSLIGVAINTPTNDTDRIHSYDLWGEAWDDFLTTSGKYLGTSTYFDASRLPRGSHIIYHEGNLALASSITILPGWSNIATTDIDGIQLSIVAKTDWYDVRFPFAIHSRQPTYTLAFDVLDLSWGKMTHLM